MKVTEVENESTFARTLWETESKLERYAQVKKIMKSSSLDRILFFGYNLSILFLIVLTLLFVALLSFSNSFESHSGRGGIVLDDSNSSLLENILN
jgi:hypothetical protein